MSESPKVVHTDQLRWIQQSHGEHFQVRRKQLGTSAGGKKLGCSLYELPPGCRA